MEQIRKTAEYLPLKLKTAFLRLSDKTINATDELRLYKNGVFSIFAMGKSLFTDGFGGLCTIDKCIRVTEEDIRECVYKLSQGSMYSYDATVNQGFIPLPYGRAGICGDTVWEDGCVKRMREITSVSLRIHRNIPDYGKNIIALYKAFGLKGTLIYSPPGMGKTTLIRSVAQMLGRGVGISPVKVGIADERREIVLPNTDFGTADTVSGCAKSVAAEMLTRTMSPKVIICDEITEKDKSALEYACTTGVYLICSCHAMDKSDLYKKEFLKSLLQDGAFGILVSVHRKDGRYGYTAEVL